MSVKKKKKKIGWVVLVVVLVLAAGSVFARQMSLKSRQPDLSNVKTAKAVIGTIEKTVSGTGNLTTEDIFEEINVQNGLKIDTVAFESGDTVKKGDVLATFDGMALQTAIWDTQDKLNSLDTQINQVRSKTESTYILASVAGRIKQVLVSKSDSVANTMQSKGALLILSIDGKMRVSFVPVKTDGLIGGEDVLVKLSDGTQKTGTIESISKNACVVTLSDKTPEVNDAVIVTLKNGTELGKGNLVINRPISVTGTEGSVKSVLKSKNTLVSKGTRLVELEQGAVSREYLKLAATRTEQEERLKILLGYAEQNNTLTVPMDGTIEKVILTKGQTTGSSTGSGSSAATNSTSTTPAATNSTTPAAAASTTAASAGTSTTATNAFTIKTKSTIKLVVDIDELDIPSIVNEQKANVTLDALPGKTLAGTLVKIADTGTSSQGGTAYAVTVDLPVDQSLKQGMTATAVITVDRRENIVRIPLEALQESGKEQYVYVGVASSATALGEKRIVKTGISDGLFVEIVSGLTSGEGVNYYYADSSSSMMPFGNGGGFSRPNGTTSSVTPATSR